MIFKLFLIVFALLAWRKTWQQYQREHVSRYWLASSSLLWLLVITVALAPDWTSLLAARLGVGRGADLILYSAVLLLSYVVLRLVARRQELSRELTDLTRLLAIKEAEPPQTK